MAEGQGSTGNVIAALCSLFIPGLGQLVQGRVLSAVLWFVAACVFGAITFVLSLGLLTHFGWLVVGVFSCISAATYRRP
jgi:TM2 domain-containing membrane protein YozV